MSAAPALVRVTLTQQVRDPVGGLWNPGEVAGFEPDVAASLIERGAAVATPVRAPAGPPADKMIGSQMMKREPVRK